MENKNKNNSEIGKMFATIHAEYGEMLFRMFRRKKRSTADAEDAVSDFILHFCEKMNDGRGIGDKLNIGFIAKSFKNFTLDLLKKKKPSCFSELICESQDGEENFSAIPEMKSEALSDAGINALYRSTTIGFLLNQLSEENRQYINLRFLKGYSNPEIAAYVNKPTDYVAVRVSRAKCAFSQLCKKYGFKRDDL